MEKTDNSLIFCKQCGDAPGVEINGWICCGNCKAQIQRQTPTVTIPKEVNRSLIFDILADNDVTAGSKTINGKFHNVISNKQLVTIFEKYIEFYQNGGIKED